MRAGVIRSAKGGRGRGRNKGYGRDRDLGIYDDPLYNRQGRQRVQASECNEVCQYKKLLGLSDEDSSDDLEKDNDYEDTVDNFEESEETTTKVPCTGLCLIQKKKNLPEDEELAKIKRSRKNGARCVGLCYIRRKNGFSQDNDLEKLRKNPPCVGLCYILRKKMKELDEIGKEE